MKARPVIQAWAVETFGRVRGGSAGCSRLAQSFYGALGKFRDVLGQRHFQHLCEFPLRSSLLGVPLLSPLLFPPSLCPSLPSLSFSLHIYCISFFFFSHLSSVLFCLLPLKLEKTNNKTKKTYLSHRLVALTFIPNPNNYPQVNHKDENKQNNHVSNLEWCTNKYNINYGTGIQRRSNTLKGENNYNSKKVRCIETGQIFNCERCANEFLGKTVKNRNISACCRGERKTSYGYHWEYIEGEKSEAHI